MSTHHTPSPLVSVLIPAWNVAPWIGECLCSVLSQSVADFECIVVDDGSTDDTARVVQSFGDPRIRLIRQENRGECMARNRAMEEAKGRFVAFLDADDYWDLCFLEKLLAVFEANPEVDLAFCGWSMFMDGTGLRKRQPWTNVHATGNVWYDMLLDAVFCMGAWMVKRDAIPFGMNFLPGIPVGGDRDFLLRLLAHIYTDRQHTALGIPDRLLWYRQRSSSSVRQAEGALANEWRLMTTHLEHPGVPEKIRKRGFSNLAFKMSVIAAFGCKNFRMAVFWYAKALRLAPLNLNLYWMPLRKLFFSLLPARPARRSILFLTLRADFGGGPEHLWRLLRHLPPGTRACVACPQDYPYYDRYRACVGEENIFILPHRRFSLPALWRLRRFCRERGTAVLHSHGKGAGVYARLLAALTGLPCVHTYHGVHMGGYGRLEKFIYRLCERFFSLFTHAAITVSEGERAQILAEGLIPPAKLRLIPNGVEVPEVASGEAVGPPFRVISMSRFDYQKNSEFLLSIAQALCQHGRLGDFHFLIVGDGLGKAHVLSAAKMHGLASSLECPGASPEPHSFFKGALCYISTSRWEGMPLAVLEAMAHGLPAVVTDVAGNRDAVINGETGYIYPEGDPQEAASALCRLADDSQLRQVMAGQARKHVRQCHDARRMAQETLDVLRSHETKH